MLIEGPKLLTQISSWLWTERRVEFSLFFPKLMGSQEPMEPMPTETLTKKKYPTVCPIYIPLKMARYFQTPWKLTNKIFLSLIPIQINGKSFSKCFGTKVFTRFVFAKRQTWKCQKKPLLWSKNESLSLNSLNIYD